MNKLPPRILVATLAVIGVACTAAPDGRSQMGSSHLRVKIASVAWPKVVTQLHNRSAKDLMVWEDGNSWGYYNWEVAVEGAGGETPAIIIRRKEATWTGNFASARKIRPRKHWEQVLDMSDGKWEVEEDLDSFKGRKMIVRYGVKNTPEAAKYGVQPGEWLSRPVIIR